MRLILNLLLAIVIALGVGFGLSYLALDRGLLLGSQRIGAWVTWPNAGTFEPDPYTRAHLARDPSLVLNVAEGVSFIAKTDDNDEPLRGNCTYRLDGPTPQAAFWTLTATNQAGELITPANRAHSLMSTSLMRQSDGSAIVRVGATLSAGNWLEISPVSEFQLALNLYAAADFSGLGDQNIDLPTITREACS